MRIRLYHELRPQGKIFTDQEEHDQALKKGWVEAPWLVGQQQEDPQPVEDEPKGPNPGKKPGRPPKADK